MFRNWIGIFNVFAMIVILAGSLSPAQEDNAFFVGEIGGNTRKVKIYVNYMITLQNFYFPAVRECFNASQFFNSTRFKKRLQQFRQRFRQRLQAWN